MALSTASSPPRFFISSNFASASIFLSSLRFG
jgi:hypothetical protein